MAIVERVKTATAFGPATGTHGFDLFACLTLRALVLGRGVVPVHGTDVIAIGAIFGGELPVALVDIRAGATQHFEALWGLINNHVNDLRRLAQMLGQRSDIGVKAAKQETAIGLKPCNLGQVMGAFAVEALRVTGFAGVFDLEQLAAVVEGPAVERASITGAIPRFVSAQHRAAMTARIKKGVQLTRLVARDKNRLTPHGGG